MKILLKMFKPLLVKALKKELQDPKNKSDLVTLVNAKVNVPKLEEDEEERVFNQIYDVVRDILLLVVERI